MTEWEIVETATAEHEGRASHRGYDRISFTETEEGEKEEKKERAASVIIKRECCVCFLSKQNSNFNTTSAIHPSGRQSRQLNVCPSHL